VKWTEETDQDCQDWEPSRQKVIPAGGVHDHGLTGPLLK